MFLVEGNHDLVSDDQSQFDINSYDQADSYFHSEHDLEFNADLYMHYENEDVNSVLPSVLFQDANLIGGIDEKDNFILPQENFNEN